MDESTPKVLRSIRTSATNAARSERSSRHRARWRARIAAGSALVASTTTVVGTSSALAAGGCDAPPGLNWIVSSNNPEHIPVWRAEGLALVSQTPDFLVSEQRVVDNGTSTPITATFTSSVAKTFTLTVSANVGVSLFGFLTASVSASITQSTTTTTGVSATAPVAAYGRVIGQYGVEAYDVTYKDNRYTGVGHGSPPPSCYLASSDQYSTVAPTVYAGWRVLPG